MPRGETGGQAGAAKRIHASYTPLYVHASYTPRVRAASEHKPLYYCYLLHTARRRVAARGGCAGVDMYYGSIKAL